MAADGSLKFDTKIDTTDFDKSIATLEKALDRFSAAIDRLSEKIVSGFQGAGTAAQEVGEKAQEASKGVDAIGEAAEEAEKKVESLEEQMAKIRVHGLEENSASTAPEEPRVSMVPEYAMGYDPDVVAFVENWGNATETAAGQTDSLQQSVGQAEAVIREFPGAVEPTAGIVGTTTSLIADAFKYMAAKTVQSFKKIPDVAKFALSKAGQIVGGFAKTLAYPVTSAAKKACTGIKNLINPSKRASNAILKLSGMFKMMLIRMAMRAVIQGVKEGMQNLVQYSSSANQSMSELTSGALYLKNSFATAFSSILSFVVPAINTLINALAAAMGYINQFFSALGGSTTFTRAKKTQENYANSLKKTGSAADDAKKSVAGFDKLTVLNDQKSGGGSSSGTDPSEMFETVQIDGAISGFANQIKAAFESGDWKELGTLIGSKFNELVDGVDWDGIGHKAGYAFNGAIQTIYYTLSEIDFTNLGSSVAQLINGGLSEIDFTFVGRILTRGFTAGFDFLLGFLGTLDWGLIGRSVGDLLRGSFDEAYDWMSGIDWSQMASDLYDNTKACLTGVDFASLAESFFKALGGALGAGVSFVATFVKKVVEDIVGYFAQYIKDENGDGKFGGKEIINGLYEGIVDGIKNVGTWIKEHVFDPFMEGIKTCFGIHSPSTVMKEIGGYLIEGLKNGIENAVPSLRGVINGIISLLEDALNYIVDGINGLSFDVPDWVPKIGGTTFGFDIRPFHLPRLASGTVVPPRAGEFAAILGDNNRETEVVSPLSTIKQALLEAMREGGMGAGGDIQITLNLDGKTVYDTIVKRNQMTKKQTGKNPLLA